MSIEGMRLLRLFIREPPVEHQIDAEPKVGAIDQEIAELATRQHGIVSRAQLVELGLGRGGIGSRLRRGLLHPLHRCTYAVGHRNISREGRWLAATLSCGPDAVLSHSSAAEVWGLLDRSNASLVHVTKDGSSRVRKGVRIHEGRLQGDERDLRFAIPVTTVARTLLDLAVMLNPGQVRRAFDRAEALEMTSPASVPDLLQRYPGRPGTRVLKELLARNEPARMTRSGLEDFFLAFLERKGLPLPETNVWLTIGDAMIEADCVWRENKLIIELDAFSTHGSRTSFEKDRDRDRRLQARGWRIARVTGQQIQAEHELTRDLLQLLRLDRSRARG